MISKLGGDPVYRSITKSLTFRITLVICILILPINLFVISLSNQIVKRIESELLASYEMELAIYMTKIDESILKVDNQLKQVISQNWLDLDEKFARVVDRRIFNS